MAQTPKQRAWSIDQLAKSEFFHTKLHEWRIFETGKEIAGVKGEKLDWDLEALHISEEAWSKIIHNGIKPVIAFAHPDVLSEVHYAVAYYRMLSMASQKSMRNVGLATDRYEQAREGELPALPSPPRAAEFARHFNKLASRLVEADEKMEAREFDLWRGMAAGTQAQGSWQNNKGDVAEGVIDKTIRNRLRTARWIATETEQIVVLQDGRRVEFGDEPDVAIYQGETILVAVEVKGGIDKAGVLERIGAALKSLSRAKQENPEAVTILVLQAVSLTDRGEVDLKSHADTIGHWFAVEDIVDEADVEEAFFRLLDI
jgi:hypothetical protein